MAHADIEHLTSLIRVWKNDADGYGDPFDFGVAVRWLNRHEIEITIQQTKLTPAVHRAITTELAKFGVKRIMVKTFPDGKDGPEKIRWIEVQTKKE
jgi:hypothetical protein